MRRDCQEIIPGLLLGPFVVSKQLDKLLQLGITHMYAIYSFWVVAGLVLTYLRASYYFPIASGLLQLH